MDLNVRTVAHKTQLAKGAMETSTKANHTWERRPVVPESEAVPCDTS